MGSSVANRQITGVWTDNKIYVEDYHAVPDGSTDNQAALLAALNAAAANLPATVIFDKGDYNINNGVYIALTQGDGGLTIKGQGANITRIVLSGGASQFTTDGHWHGLKIYPSSNPSVGDTANYLHDIVIEGIGFYDEDPENHAAPIAETGSITGGTNTLTLSGANAAVADGTAIRIAGAGTAGAMHTTTVASGGGTVNIVLTDNAVTTVSDALIYSVESGVSEETHGVNVQYGYGVRIINCNFESIGDEGIEVDYCEDVIITGNKLLNTPAAELSGGGGISIKNGCENVIVNDNVVDGYGAGAYNVYGINLKIISANAIKNITVDGNTIRDTQFAGINFNNAAAVTCSNIMISNNTVDNSLVGIRRSGANPSEFVSVIANIVSNCANGIDFDVSATDNLDCNISFNTLDTCSDTGITANGTRLMISGNNLYTCSRGIHIFSGADISIVGGMFESCGGTNIEEIEAQTCDNLNIVGIHILNSNATSACIKGGDNGRTNVKDCVIERAAPLTNAANMIFNATNVIGCDLEGGIRLLSTATGGVISGNKITYGAETGTANTKQAILIAAGNDYYSVTGNSINTSASTNNQYCIDIAAGATNTVVVGNSLQATTAGAGNTLNDGGTGTVSASNGTT